MASSLTSPASTSDLPSLPQSSRTSADIEIEPKESTTLVDVDANGADRYARLTNLLQRSAVYTKLLTQRIEQQRQAKKQQGEPVPKPGDARKRARASHDDAPGALKRPKTDIEQAAPRTVDFEQPQLVTGAEMRDYQLAGVQWMIGLYENGLNGILADEMGLGKTLQTIAFIAALMERGVTSPILVVCPLSVLYNWVSEFRKFAKDIPVVAYYGDKDARAELRRTVLRARTEEEDGEEEREPVPVSPLGSNHSKSAKGARGKKSTSTSATSKKPNANVRRRSTRCQDVTRDDEDELATENSNASFKPKAAAKTQETIFERVKRMFPVVICTYEIVMKDQKYLGGGAYKWGFIIVDEGHRLKNLNCKLIQEIKKYASANRLILTGTPLHNNLAELWSLLNFILPDIFDDLALFQQWFNFNIMQDSLNESRTSQVVQTLHTILSPFLLRRLKSDVEANLPPKKQYTLFVPLTTLQRNLYTAVLDGALRDWLIKSKQGPHASHVDSMSTAEPTGRSMRPRDVIDYSIESDDDEYLTMLEAGEVDARRQRSQDKELKAAREAARKDATRQVNRMHLKNTTMQLRKVSCHPFVFDWPVDPVTREFIINEELVDASGKMMLLDRLLQELFVRGHRVLLFSQFTTVLDIVEEWATLFKKWIICRIDGSTSQESRRSQVDRFNAAGSGPQDPSLFLLSTRAGGLGINLTSADTVIFFDQDWNPQMDLQAQDRAHRIGQTKPVLIFRLVTAHTIETKILQRAGEKRKLEAMVIQSGKFKNPTAQPSESNPGELAASLLRLDGEQVDVISKGHEVISDETLDMLLDRSPEVFLNRRKGWNSGDKSEANVAKTGHSGVTFEVFEAPADDGNDALAGMLTDDDAAEST